jgi:feruloyl esterase
MKIQKALIATFLAASFCLVFACGVVSAGQPMACESLLASTQGGQINTAQVVPAGGGLPEYCQVKGTLEPAVNYELRLPTTTWNGKFLHVGGGSRCGDIRISSGNSALVRGYAIVNTDCGHIKNPADDCDFGYNNDQAEIDYGYRAVHIVTDAAKHLIKDFYSRPPKFSYFQGCSTGGRQALIEVQRFPKDFDGVIAGDPIMYYTGQSIVQHGWSAIANNGADGKPILTVNKLAFISTAAHAACDGLDGLVDGIIDDPRRCNFDPTTLMCPGGGTGSDCLSAAQVEVVKKYYEGPKDSSGTPLFFGGYPPGSEPSWSGQYIDPTGASSMALFAKAAEGHLRYLAFNIDPGPTYKFLTDFDLDTDVAKLHERAWEYNASDPDIRQFRDHGGKLILYAGGYDSAMYNFLSYYYNQVAKQTGGSSKTQKWFRLFMVPGMNHCSGGPGPNTFDMLTALEDWVEHHKAPDRIIASHVTSGNVDRTRPLCPYPQVARWNGNGGTDGINYAENFNCVKPDYKLPPNFWDNIECFPWDQFKCHNYRICGHSKADRFPWKHYK